MSTTRDERICSSGMPVEVFTPSSAGGACAVMLHERYGYVEHSSDMTRSLAEAGFVALGPDLFFDQPDQAALKAGTAPLVQLPDAVVGDRLGECAGLLETIPDADPSRLVIIGSCQSGRYPYIYAAEHDLRGFVVLYGGDLANDWQATPGFPSLDAYIAQLSCPMLGIFGEADHVISVDHVRQLRNAFEEHRKSYWISVYPDAPHGWLNSTLPGRYRADAAKRAWEQALGFVRDVTSDRDAPPSRARWRFDADIDPEYDFSRQSRQA